MLAYCADKPSRGRSGLGRDLRPRLAAHRAGTHMPSPIPEYYEYCPRLLPTLQWEPALAGCWRWRWRCARCRWKSASTSTRCTPCAACVGCGEFWEPARAGHQVGCVGKTGDTASSQGRWSLPGYTHLSCGCRGADACPACAPWAPPPPEPRRCWAAESSPASLPPKRPRRRAGWRWASGRGSRFPHACVRSCGCLASAQSMLGP